MNRLIYSLLFYVYWYMVWLFNKKGNNMRYYGFTTKRNFIKESEKVHNNNYDYSLVPEIVEMEITYNHENQVAYSWKMLENGYYVGIIFQTIRDENTFKDLEIFRDYIMERFSDCEIIG